METGAGNARQICESQAAGRRLSEQEDLLIFPRLWLLTAALAFRAAAQAPDAAQIRQVTAEIARITGLEVKRDVPSETITRQAWKQWVDDEIRRTVKPEEIRADETTLRILGLIPKDFDLRKATVDLLGEQAAALYDHRRRKMLFVEGGAAGIMQEAVLVHELSHALADQHFDMRRFLDKGAKTDESQTARLAVVEGQAMWIMIESQVQRMGGASLTKNRTALDMMLPAMGQLAADSYPVFARAPLYLRETLVFPYTAGLLFQQAAVERFGKQAFSEVLRNPPNTTSEVLHPERWPAKSVAAAPSLPPMDTLKSLRKASSGTLGELDVRILLKQYTSPEDADRVAPLWRAGAFELLEDRKDGHATVRWAIEMESPEAAQQLLSLYARVIEGKWKTASFEQRSATRLEGRGEAGGFQITAEGAVVRGLEGLKR